MRISNLINPKEIRKFGLIAFIFFGILFALALWREKELITYFFGILFFLAIGFILAPFQMRSVYAVWLKMAHAIGSGVTVLMLTIVFYFVITPSALIKRIFGGRPLPVKYDKNAPTYWVTRSESAQPLERFAKRF